MPIDYTIDRDNGIVLVTWSGDVTIDELRRHLNAMLADPEALALRRSLSDVRRATLLFTGAELASLVATVLTPTLGNAGWKLALIVAQTAQYGMSRQFHVFAGPSSKSSIFFDRETALAWLLAP